MSKLKDLQKQQNQLSIPPERRNVTDNITKAIQEDQQDYKSFMSDLVEVASGKKDPHQFLKNASQDENIDLNSLIKFGTFNSNK